MEYQLREGSVLFISSLMFHQLFTDGASAVLVMLDK